MKSVRMLKRLAGYYDNWPNAPMTRKAAALSFSRQEDAAIKFRPGRAVLSFTTVAAEYCPPGLSLIGGRMKKYSSQGAMRGRSDGGGRPGSSRNVLSSLLVPAMVLMISAFSTGALQARNEVADSVSGAPETEYSPPRPARPPVTYSTPDTETMKAPPAPGGYLQQDFENLYYQKEMWRQYQEDYEKKHRPRDSR